MRGAKDVKIFDSPPASSEEDAGERGYVLLAVTIILVIMGIFMGLAVPVWQHVMQREREEELIFRGQQYVRAIELYQTKFPGAFPANIDVLVEQKFLRKAYPDPMAEDGEWKILRQLSPEIRRMMNPAARARGAGARNQGGIRLGQSERDEEQEPAEEEEGLRSRTPSRLGQSRLSRGSEQGLGGIVGVVSTSDEESIRVYDGKNKYNEWLFVYMQETRGRRRPGGGRRGPGLDQQPGQQPGVGQPGIGTREPGLGPGFRSKRRQPQKK
jgi:type II secretory pathway pseudopilin PulG